MSSVFCAGPRLLLVQLDRQNLYFGARMNFELTIRRRSIPDQVLIAHVRRVASELNLLTLTIDIYNERGKYASTTLTRRFGNWPKVLILAQLAPSRNPLNITYHELMKNLENVWRILGKQPRYQDMNSSVSAYSAGTHENRYGGWNQALEVFVDEVKKADFESRSNKTPPRIKSGGHQTSRSINYRLRYLVLRRDNFKCKYCGRSPSTTPGLELEPDHVIPWSAGGEATLENLRSSCSECNIGKVI